MPLCLWACDAQTMSATVQDVGTSWDDRVRIWKSFEEEKEPPCSLDFQC